MYTCRFTDVEVCNLKFAFIYWVTAPHSLLNAVVNAKNNHFASVLQHLCREQYVVNLILYEMMLWQVTISSIGRRYRKLTKSFLFRAKIRIPWHNTSFTTSSNFQDESYLIITNESKQDVIEFFIKINSFKDLMNNKSPLIYDIYINLSLFAVPVSVLLHLREGIV